MLTFCNDLAILRWADQSGDPGLLPWVAVMLYLGASGLACVAARSGKGQAQTLFWAALTCLALGLAFNKQLDLQTLILRCGRVVAQQNGWAGHRKGIELVFALIISAGLLMLVSKLTLLLRGRDLALRLAAAGGLITTLFVLLRSATILHVPGLTVMTSSWLRSSLELTGAAFMLLGAGLAATHRFRDRRQNRADIR
ncbi:hypothetical protein F4U94_17190 [Sphingobium limneticum]|uniref:hypothetical protein n=1 Tax=Sphingobium limneticum TaxID=1007511 RepID=UPI00123D6988|nr:hypothetical protein [Sphingobium limneticum]KAA9013034.1 hypothetical protein F4U94_17190 [Sphingobium limneticum]